MRIEEIISQSIDIKAKILNNKDFIKEISRAVELLIETFKNGNKVLFCGNGGSAADAQHLAAEFSGRFYYDRPPLRAEALHVNTSYLTAVANDYSYDMVYSRMIRALGDRNDVLVAISTSGNSKNIILALEEAKKRNMKIISLSGLGGGLMKEFSDIIFEVPSKDTPRVQESHIMIGHILCELVESSLFPKN